MIICSLSQIICFSWTDAIYRVFELTLLTTPPCFTVRFLLSVDSSRIISYNSSKPNFTQISWNPSRKWFRCSFHIIVCLCVCVSVCLCVCPVVCLSVCRFVCLFVCLSICLRAFVYLIVSIFTCSSVSACVPICIFQSLITHLVIRSSVSVQSPFPKTLP